MNRELLDTCQEISAHVRQAAPRQITRQQAALWSVSLAVCHDEVNPMRLDDMLLAAREGRQLASLLHDLAGIASRMDWQTRQLSGLWSPRYTDSIR